MGTNRTPKNVRGFIVPWQLDKKSYWTAQSNATQGKKRAGVPEAQNPTSLILGTRGTQTNTIEVETIEAGHVTEGAKFGWKYETDPNVYGHNVPNILTAVDAVAKNSLVARKFITRAAATTTDGNTLCAVEYTTATTNNVRVYKIDPEGNSTFVSLNTVDISTLSGQFRHPTLVTLANGNVLCIFWAIDIVGSTANVQVYQTIDQGTTWDLISNRGLQTEIDITGLTLQRIAGAATASQCVLFLEAFKSSGTNRNLCFQYASVSQGAKFSYVAQSPASATTYRVHQPNVVVYNGVYVLSFIRNNDTIGVTQFTDAYADLFNTLVFNNVTEIVGVDFAITSSSTIQNGDKYMHIDVDGRIYIYARLVVNNVVSCAFSDCAGIEAIEYGRTWQLMGPDPAVASPKMQHAIVFDPGACGELANIATTFYNGQQLVLCNWDNNGTNAFADSVMALSFGMWATQINPRLAAYPDDSQWAHNTQDWAPVDLPTQGGQWTLTPTGSPSISLDADRLDIACAGGEAVDYARGIVDKLNGVTMHVALDQQTGGSSTTGNYIGVAINTTGSGALGYHVRVYITPTELYLYDMLATNQLASVTGLPLDGRALYLHVDNATGKCTLYYASINGPRQYATLVGTASVGGVGTQQYTWGSTVTTIGTTCSWAYVSYSEGNEIGLGVDPTLNGKQYPAIGFYAALDDGLYITTQDGPARNTDKWLIMPEFETPINRVLYSLYPSRGVTWRSDAVANADTDLIPTANISWAIDSDNLGVDVRSRNGVVGIHLSNINFKNMQIQLYQSGAWVTHSTIKNQSGSDFNYARLGNTVRVTSTPSDTPFYHYNECAGWYILLKDGENEVVRKIRTNSEGVLDSTTNTKTVVFTIEGAKSTDPTSGTVAQLIPNACTILLHRITDLAAVRITINTQQTNEGYFKIGHMVMGPVVIPATQYGRGRTINWEANTDTVTGPNGVQYANVRGNGGRTIRVGWVDGVDISELCSDNPTPDYYTTESGSLPEAAIGSAPTTMVGIVQQMQGENNAVVYLPVIDTTGDANHDVINRYHDHCMVTLGSDVQIENVIGDESTNEVLRVGTVVMREVR